VLRRLFAQSGVAAALEADVLRQGSDVVGLEAVVGVLDHLAADLAQAEFHLLLERQGGWWGDGSGTELRSEVEELVEGGLEVL
jgi:hypothetical protein